MEDKRQEDRVSKLLVIIAIVLLGVGSIQAFLRAPLESKIIFHYKLSIEFKEGKTGSMIFFSIPLNTTWQIVRIIKRTGSIVLVNSTHIGFPLDRVGRKGYLLMRIEVRRRHYPYPLFTYKPTATPEDLKKFIGKPRSSVNTLIKEIEVKVPQIVNESDVGKAYILARFLRDHFTYSAAGLPRDIDEVLASRKGDCDDLSALLIELLWFYGIPAQIEYSYIFTPGLSEVYRIGNSTFIRTGFMGHAYVLAYLGNLRWLPIDVTYCAHNNPLLGSTYITYSIVISRRARPFTLNDIKNMLKPLEERTIIISEELILLSPIRRIYRTYP